jgi:Glyoxalase superfamily protein/Clp amino terminal domain, pathogenicity island component
MRDYRDAKAMAQSIRSELAARGFKITIGGSLDLIAKAFGAADWNTLAAAIKTTESEPRDAATPARAGPAMFSEALAAALHRATESAAARRNEYTTVEHLLLALADDADAAAVMEACRVDPRLLKTMLSGYLDEELSAVAHRGEPTEGFHHVIRFAVLLANESGRRVVTGANVLQAIFRERSHAAALLEQLGMTRFDAVNFIAFGIRKDGGKAA